MRVATLLAAGSRRSFLVWIWIALAAWAPRAASAAGGVVLAREGESAEEAGAGLTFSGPFGLLEPRLSEDGRTVVFPAFLSPGSVPSVWLARQEESGEWSRTAIAVDERPLENSGALLTGSHSGVLDPQTARWVFAGELRPPGGGQSTGGIFIAEAGGPPRRILADGDGVPGSSNGETIALPRPSIFANGPPLRASGGTVLFEAAILGGARASGVFAWKDGDLRLITRSGPSGTPPFVFNIERYPELLLTAGGAGALLAHAVTGQQFLFHVDAAENLFLIGTLGLQIPGVLPVPAFAGITMSSTGALSYMSAASLSPEAPKTLYVFDNAPFPTGRLRRRAAPGDAAPGLQAGVRFSDLGWPQMAGEWVGFLARLAGGGSDGALALYRVRAAGAESDAPEAVAAVGDSIETSAGDTAISRLYSFTLEPGGEFLIDLQTAGGQRLLAHAARPRALEVVLGTDVPFSWSAPGEAEPITGPGVLPQSPVEEDVLLNLPATLLRNVEDGKGGPWFAAGRAALQVLDTRAQPPIGMIVALDLARLVVNSTRDLPDARPGDGRCDTGSEDSVAFDEDGEPARECTLRAAIEEANATEARDDITVEIRDQSGELVFFPEIRLESPLPAIEYAVSLDGTTQDDGNGPGPLAARGVGAQVEDEIPADVPLPRRNMPMLVGGTPGVDPTRSVTFHSNGSEFRGFALLDFQDAAVAIRPHPSGDPNRRGARNRLNGLLVDIDPSMRTLRLVASESSYAILIADAPENVIGAPGAPCVIHFGRRAGGIAIEGGFARGNRVEGTYIFSTSSLDSIDPSVGILVCAASNNRIGSADAGNVLWGCFCAISVTGGGRDHIAAGNRIQGNRIGTDSSGRRAAPYPNQIGITLGKTLVLDRVLDTLIGGPDGREGNLISANESAGIVVTTDVRGTVIQSNLIGTDVDGRLAVPNRWGVVIDGAEETIVGDPEGSAAMGPHYPIGNVINGNGPDKLETLVDEGNILDVLAGMLAGVPGPTSVRIEHGAALRLHHDTRTVVAGNFIGTDASWNARQDARNLRGIVSRSSTLSTIVGNLIAHSRGPGIFVQDGIEALIRRNVITLNGREGVSIGGASRGIRLQENAIYRNDGIGIDLVAADDMSRGQAMTPNDFGDRDTGPNHLQNFPDLAVLREEDGFRINYWLGSTPDSRFRIEFFGTTARSPSSPDAKAGSGEGARFFHAVDNIPGDRRVESITGVRITGDVLPRWLTATATKIPLEKNEAPDTSEFSFAAAIPWEDADTDGAPDEQERRAPERRPPGGGGGAAPGGGAGAGGQLEELGDGNGDGVPDAEQRSVASFPSAALEYVTIEAPAGAELRDTEPLESFAAPGFIELPLGAFAFRVVPDSDSATPLAPGAVVELRLFLPALAADLDASGYYVFGPDFETGSWSDFAPRGELGATFDGDVVTLRIRDGGAGDNDGEANGSITHVGAPATLTGACFRSLACTRAPGSDTIDVAWELIENAPDCDCESFELREVSGAVLASLARDARAASIACADLGAPFGRIEVACRKVGGGETFVSCLYSCIPTPCPVTDATCDSDGETLSVRWSLADAPADCGCREIEIADDERGVTLARLDGAARTWSTPCGSLSEPEGRLRIYCRGEEELSSSLSCAYRCEAPAERRFLRGDANGDGASDIADAVFLLDWLFLGAEGPACRAAANVNGDGATDISDVVTLLLALFAEGVEIPPPFAQCGPPNLPIDSAFGCDESPACAP